MWKKVLYFGIAIVIGILVYIIGYSSNQMNHLESMVSSAIASEEYYKVPMVWGGCFDTKSIVDGNTDKLTIRIYPATSQTDVTYGEEENSTRYLEFERAYYLYIFNGKFSIDTVTTGTSSYNKTAIEFSSNEGSYEYFFVVNDTMNSSMYVETPKSKEEALLNDARDVTNTNANWNFMRITFTETMLNQILKEINGSITKLSVKACDGEVVYSTDIQLDFSQGFFEDAKLKDMLDKYNTYLKAYLESEGDSNKLKELNATWGTQFEEWKADFQKDIPNTGYALGYERDVVTPSKLVWQTIGMLALYALVIILFYILIFHFSAIKRIFTRENYREYSRDSSIIVNGKRVKRTNGKLVKETPAKEEAAVLPDTSADESLETVTAESVVATPVVEEASTEEAKEPTLEETTPVQEIEEPVVVEDKKEEVKDDIVEEEPKVEKTENPATPKKSTAPKTTASKRASTTSKKSTTTTKKSTSTKKSTPSVKENKNETN
ncbi:MAG: hypothetical protein K2J85_03565 [Anaeroplasmataceae bacterium]|nr:hypothetical protein [Anaeroplasmataceae bacterium]